MSTTDLRQQELFGWTDGLVVLLVDRADGAWIVARGWRHDDRLVDVRRWRFDTERRMVGQIRRLVHEATEQHSAADIAAARLTEWIVAHAGADQ